MDFTSLHFTSLSLHFHFTFTSSQLTFVESYLVPRYRQARKEKVDSGDGSALYKSLLKEIPLNLKTEISF